MIIFNTSISSVSSIRRPSSSPTTRPAAATAFICLFRLFLSPISYSIWLRFLVFRRPQAIFLTHNVTGRYEGTFWCVYILRYLYTLDLYVYIYIYIYIYICVYVYIYIYIYVYLFKYVYIYTYLYIYICICIYLCVYIYLYIYMHLLVRAGSIS